MPDTITALAEHLRVGDVAYAVIGAAAMSARGYPRQTLDFDLLVVDRLVLEASFWRGWPKTPEIRKADSADPLAGVVRFETPEIDIIVGRYRWQAEAIERAEEIQVAGRTLPVVTLSDLILLKLHAGGYRDAADVKMMLAGADETVVANVERVLPALPADARRLWNEVRASEGKP
jgi:hypothetical protein